MTKRNRRSFVTTIATAGTLGLAGCSSKMRKGRGTDGEPTASQTRPQSNETDDGTSAAALPSLPGKQLENFESLEEWTAMIDAGKLTAETDDPYAGSQSAHLSAGSNTDYTAAYTVSGEWDLREKNLSIAVRFTGRDQLRLTLELYAPNSRNVYALERTLTGPRDRWVRVDFGTGQLEGQPDLATVSGLRVTARRRGDRSGALNCSVDDIRAVDRPKTGKVMFLFDGTLESHRATAFERMQSYGFAGVEAVIPEAVGEGGRLTIDELTALDDAGWDMAARPRTGAHFLHEFPPARQKGMIRQTKAYLESRGFEDGAKHFVTPRNILSPTAHDLLEEYHEQAFRFGGGPNALPLTDPYNVGFFSGAAGDVTKRYVDYAADYGQLAVLKFDYFGGENGISERAFDDVLEYVAERDVNVVTATELLNG
ncbi:polysaccharide deacetylase family protein [Natrinema sp. 74]|uniref:polysaccharide deacetylase family protein n=1 Tax=Natrinema sp. 74 TaxID=3384159 RepID=UPI0038D35CF1